MPQFLFDGVRASQLIEALQDLIAPGVDPFVVINVVTRSGDAVVADICMIETKVAVVDGVEGPVIALEPRWPSDEG